MSLQQVVHLHLLRKRKETEQFLPGLNFSTSLKEKVAMHDKQLYNHWKWIIVNLFRQTWVAAHSIEVTPFVLI